MANIKKAGDPSGPVATAIANVLAVINTPWALVGTTVIAFVAAWFKWARDILFSPGAAVFAGVWLTLWWTYVAVRLLADGVKSRRVTVDWDCAYCITIDGSVVTYDVSNPDSCFQIMLNFRNLGNGPIRFKPVEFRVQIDDRVGVGGLPPEIIIQRLSTKGMPSGTLKKDAVPARGKAQFRAVLVYGRHDDVFTRKFTVEGEVNFRVENNVLTTGGAAISSEADEPYSE